VTSTCTHWLKLAVVLCGGLLFAGLLGGCGGPVARVGAGAGQEPAAREPQVLVVTVAGKLGTQEFARCHRTVREAGQRGIGYVVFRFEDAGSQGESAGDLQSLLDRVQDTTVRTVALLRGRTTQGAAYAALCTDRTFCLPGATWGEINKPEQELSELLAESPDQAQAARLDSLREALGTRLERRKVKLRPDAAKVAAAMVDPRLQLVQAIVREGGIERPRILDTAELAALQGSGATVVEQTPLERPLMLDAARAEELGLSSGTVPNLDALTEALGVDRDSLGELTTNWAEHMVGWLELLQPFLLIAGFVLILFEVKTPGVGLPGLLGIAFLGLAMFHSYLVGLADVTEILVFFLGLAALAVEIFLLPGTVVFGAIGFLCLVMALVLSQQSFVLPSNTVEEQILVTNLTHVTVLFVLVLVLGAVLWRLLPRIPVVNRMFLDAPGRLAAATPAGGSGRGLVDAAATALVGRTGTAATVLRPTGTMAIDGDRFDVVTEGEFVEAGTPLRVLYVAGPRVVVAAVAPAGERPAEGGSVGLVLLLGIVGLALVVAEVFFFSFGVFGALSGVSILTAVFLAFQESVGFGATVLVLEAVGVPAVWIAAMRILPKTPFGKAMMLDGPSVPGSAAAADPSLGELLHKTGVTLSPLRPAGFARIDGKKIDVVTRGEMLDAGCPIKVLDVAMNRVVVGRQ
jgi:membrane-bound serine protease (ClpP class)